MCKGLRTKSACENTTLVLEELGLDSKAAFDLCLAKDHG